MTDGRAKGTMGKTAESYLKLWVLEQVFNCKKMISTKYMEKGNIMEDYGIDRIGAWLEIPDAVKNEQHFEDEFMTTHLIYFGRHDRFKSSWDLYNVSVFRHRMPKFRLLLAIAGIYAPDRKEVHKLIR